QQANSFPLPTQISGVRVMVNGEPAPLLFVSNSLIRFQCPAEPPGSLLDVNVETESGASTSFGQSAMRPVMPVLFTGDNTRQGVVLSGATNELATANRPARKGEFVTIYASGLGETADEVLTGAAAPLDRLIWLKNKVTVVVGGVEIEPAFAGLAPGTAG